MEIIIYWCVYDEEWSVRFNGDDLSDQVAERSRNPLIAAAGRTACDLNISGIDIDSPELTLRGYTF